jgi:hypothetical protein
MINWDVVIENTKREADDYAKGKPGEYSHHYSGYFAGKMKDAAERESLRSIVQQLEKSKDKNVPTETAVTLDSFI